MDEDVLALVISVEREIQARLESERAQARQWLEQVRREAEEDFASEIALFQESSALAEQRTTAEAEERAQRIVTEAVNNADLFLNLDDEVLRRTVMRRLDMILLE
jgi:hypothetical protein